MSVSEQDAIDAANFRLFLRTLKAIRQRIDESTDAMIGARTEAQRLGHQKAAHPHSRPIAERHSSAKAALNAAQSVVRKHEKALRTLLDNVAKPCPLFDREEA